MKSKYKGIFSLKHELFILYAYAYSKRQAWLTFCRRIAKKHGARLDYVTGLFDGSKENFKIETE